MKTVLRHLPEMPGLDLSVPYFSCTRLNKLRSLDDYKNRVMVECQAALENAHQEANSIRKEARLEAYQDIQSQFINAIKAMQNYRVDQENNLEQIIMTMLSDALECFRLQVDQWNQLNHAVTQLVKTQSNRFAIKWLVGPGHSDELRQIIASSLAASHLMQLDIVETSDMKTGEVALEFPGGARISVDANEFVQNLIESTRK